MNIGSCHTGGKDKTIGITGCVKGVGKAFLPLIFDIVAAVGVSCAGLDFLRLFLFLWGKTAFFHVLHDPY